MLNDYIFDIETYPNVFTLAVEHAHAPFKWSFEISGRRDDSADILCLLWYIKSVNGRMIGFNNLNFDYPVIHTLILMNKASASVLYKKAAAIIESGQDDDRFRHIVPQKEWFIDQIDLFKIHHFDNKAKSTSLKVLEFNMRSSTIQDLPFKPGSLLTDSEITVLKEYNQHDVSQTKSFYHHSKKMISFREDLTFKYGRNFLNHNDTKIGKDYFIMKLEEAGVSCYSFNDKSRFPKQTIRPVIHLKDAILPWITFNQPEFIRIHDWLKHQSITETKGVFNDLSAKINNFTFVFGLGGVHGSVESEIIESCDEDIIVDLDVTSYYPNLAIRNNFYPEHLGSMFVSIYKALFEQRGKYPKKSSESAMLKLALNGVYGDSNNKFSVFYDPLFTMKITLNGQLLLCLLAEEAMEINGLRIIQLNTDGITFKLPRIHKSKLDSVCSSWQKLTGLNLEENIYKSMMIRDVNNYIAVHANGSVKRIGAYEWDVEWHQNAGELVVPKVAEQVLVHNASIKDTVVNWPDVMDFMLRTKVPKSGDLIAEDDSGCQRKLQNITRYYIAENGEKLFKLLPPLSGKTDWRKIGINSGWKVQVCNDMVDAGKLPIDFGYYINEVEKLCMGLK